MMGGHGTSLLKSLVNQGPEKFRTAAGVTQVSAGDKTKESRELVRGCLARLDIHRATGGSATFKSEIALDQGPRRQQFRTNRSHNGSRPQFHRSANQRPPGIRPPGEGRHAAQNARNNYERYTTMAKDAARRGDGVQAENFYQHAEHYFRLMREQT
jgi:Domain of unknown function (DUF4167)